MVKQFLFGVILLTIVSCSDANEGFLGEWEGVSERLNDSGNLIEVEVSCMIKSASGLKRNVELKVGGKEYTFDAYDDMGELVYNEKPLNSDSTIIFYISGMGMIVNDTILRMDHDLYALKNGALLNVENEVLEMTRK